MSIRFRKFKHGGSYQVYFNYEDCGLKKRYSKGGFKTKREAQAHETEMKNEILKNGKPKPKEKKTLNEVYKEFMEVAHMEYQYNSIRTFKYSHKHFKDNIGKMYIDEIRYSHLQSFFESRKNYGIEQNKNIRKTLNATFKHARRSEYITTDPLRDIKIKGIEKHQEKHVISEADYHRIKDELKNYNDFKHDSFSIAVSLAYLQGLRLSEICALEKKDIDLDKMTININKKMNYKSLRKKDVSVSHEMKSKNSKAVLPISNELANILKEWYQINPYEKIICYEDGNYMQPEIMTNTIRQVFKKLGIKGRFHDLRHSFISNGEAKGITMMVMKDLARHSSINTTANIYTHIEESRKREAIEIISNEKCVAKVSQVDKKIKTLA
ncbi:putative uncharacterized protein [Firmicutes bacterium CAG:308]|nr:putative uncharacterized protein [Firmicutes bacterium CAG:308]